MKKSIILLLSWMTLSVSLLAQDQLTIQTVNITSSMNTVSVPVVFTPETTSEVSVFQYAINWNSDVLTFQSVSDFGISSLDENDFGKPSETGINNKLNVGWENYPASHNFVESTTLFQINFTVNENAMSGTTDVTFCSDCPQEFYDANIETMTVNYQNGAVSANALPLVWTAFQAVAINDQRVKLNWQTTAAQNVDHFSVERQTTTQWHAIHADKIAVKSSGTYQFMDTKPARGTNLYRIKQVDTDGEISYSPVRTVAIQGNNNIIYNNPFSENLEIQYTATQATSVTVEVLDWSGKIVLRNNETLSTGENSLRYSLAHLPVGWYSLRVGDTTFKVLKQ